VCSAPGYASSCAALLRSLEGLDGLAVAEVVQMERGGKAGLRPMSLEDSVRRPEGEEGG
jgi:hypothetical protein